MATVVKRGPDGLWRADRRAVAARGREVFAVFKRGEARVGALVRDPVQAESTPGEPTPYSNGSPAWLIAGGLAMKWPNFPPESLSAFYEAAHAGPNDPPPAPELVELAIELVDRFTFENIDDATTAAEASVRGIALEQCELPELERSEVLAGRLRVEPVRRAIAGIVGDLLIQTINPDVSIGVEWAGLLNQPTVYLDRYATYGAREAIEDDTVPALVGEGSASERLDRGFAEANRKWLEELSEDERSLFANRLRKHARAFLETVDLEPVRTMRDPAGFLADPARLPHVDTPHGPALWLDVALSRYMRANLAAFSPTAAASVKSAARKAAERAEGLAEGAAERWRVWVGEPRQAELVATTPEHRLSEVLKLWTSRRAAPRWLTSLARSVWLAEAEPEIDRQRERARQLRAPGLPLAVARTHAAALAGVRRSADGRSLELGMGARVEVFRRWSAAAVDLDVADAIATLEAVQQKPAQMLARWAIETVHRQETSGHPEPFLTVVRGGDAKLAALALGRQGGRGKDREDIAAAIRALREAPCRYRNGAGETVDERFLVRTTRPEKWDATKRDPDDGYRVTYEWSGALVPGVERLSPKGSAGRVIVYFLPYPAELVARLAPKLQPSAGALDLNLLIDARLSAPEIAERGSFSVDWPALRERARLTRTGMDTVRSALAPRWRMAGPDRVELATDTPEGLAVFEALAAAGRSTIGGQKGNALRDKVRR